jgi:hypothetical protein
MVAAGRVANHPRRYQTLTKIKNLPLPNPAPTQKINLKLKLAPKVAKFRNYET